MFKTFFMKRSWRSGLAIQTRVISFNSLTRCVKKRKPEDGLKILNEKNRKTLAAYATAEKYSLDGILKAVKSQIRFAPSELTTDFPLLSEVCGALHVRWLPCGSYTRHIYFFDVGTVVMWNLTYNQRVEMLRFLKDFEDLPYKPRVVKSSSELLCYQYAMSRSSYLHDRTLYFGLADKSCDMIGLNRFLISSVVSLSTKVSAVECMIDEHMGRIGKVARNIDRGKRLGTSHSQTMATAGFTLTAKHGLKQSAESLLQPLNVLEQYRSDDDQETVSNICAYFKLQIRLEECEDNLHLCEHFSKLLLKHFSHIQNRRFQNIIICLLVVGMFVAAWIWKSPKDTVE